MKTPKSVGRNVSGNNTITVITGLPRSGKSTLLKEKIIPDLLKKGKKVLVIDVNKEYRPTKNLYVFEITDYNNAEAEAEALLGTLLANKGLIDVLIVDESNVIFNKVRLEPNAKRLFNTLRHVKIDAYVVARRPVDINLFLSENAQKRYVFHASGVNDVRRLNEIMQGLGDRAFELGEHDYLIVENDRSVKLVKGD